MWYLRKMLAFEDIFHYHMKVKGFQLWHLWQVLTLEDIFSYFTLKNVLYSAPVSAGAAAPIDIWQRVHAPVDFGQQVNAYFWFSYYCFCILNWLTPSDTWEVAIFCVFCCAVCSVRVTYIFSVNPTFIDGKDQKQKLFVCIQTIYNAAICFDFGLQITTIQFNNK